MQKDLGQLVAAAAVAGEAEIGLPEAARFEVLMYTFEVEDHGCQFSSQAVENKLTLSCGFHVNSYFHIVG